MTSLAILLCALVCDKVFAELNRFHPLVGFGNIASYVESKCRNFLNISTSPALAVTVGCFATLLVVLPWVALVSIIFFLNPLVYLISSVLILYFCLGASSLKQHSLAVYAALRQDNLPLARQRVGLIVSRDVQAMSEEDVRKALIESHLENGADAIFATIFWFAVGGAPLALLHRLINTLDAMWGYKSPEYLYFGRAAAKLDDALNYVPARLVAFSYACLGNFSLALKAWKTQARKWESPNAGPVMAAGAGALNVMIGGRAVYQGADKKRATLGFSFSPTNTDVLRALALVDRTLVMWCAMYALMSVAFWSLTNV